MDSAERIQQAREMIARDEPDQAEVVLRELFSAGERSFDLIIELVLCHLMLGEDAHARRYLTMAETLDGHHSRVACYRGFLALVEGRHDAALAHFSDSLAADPRNAEAYKWRGLCFREIGDAARALADLDRAASYLRDDTTLLINRGTVHADLGNHERALADFRRACELAPNHAHPQFNAGHVLVELGRLDEAQDHYDTAIELDHMATEAWIGLSDVFAQRGEWSEVLRCLATVIGLKPDEPEAHFKLGQVLVELGDFDLGLRHLERALEADPRDPDAIAFKAVAHFHKGQLDLCLRLCERAIELAPDFGLPRLYRALARLERGVAPEDGPRHDLEVARELAPAHPGPPLVLAEILADRDQRDSAVDLLVTAVQLDPRIADRIHESPQLGRLLEDERIAARVARARADALQQPRQPG